MLDFILEVKESSQSYLLGVVFFSGMSRETVEWLGSVDFLRSSTLVNQPQNACERTVGCMEGFLTSIFLDRNTCIVYRFGKFFLNKREGEGRLQYHRPG